MTRSDIDPTNETSACSADVLIVGSGFSGIAMAIQLKQAGFDSFLIIEKAAAIGGTWRDNIYPGRPATCPRIFIPVVRAEDRLVRTYPRQPELRAYLEAIVDKHKLRPRILFNATMPRCDLG